MVVVRPVPGTTSPAVLALAVLAALGKQVEPRPREPQHQWWRLARAWTVGHQVDYLVVDRAHTLPGRLVRDVIGLAAVTGATGVWFIDAAPRRAAPALDELAGAVTERPRQLLNLTLQQPARPAQPSGRGLPLPSVVLPHTGFLYFRHACEQQLAAPDAALVGIAWERAYEAIDRWLHRLDLFAYGTPSDQHLIAELPRLAPALSTTLAATLYTARHPADALVRLRAAQAALFRVGLLLHHEPRLAAVPGRVLGCPLTPDVAATINRTMSTATAPIR